MRLHNRQAKPAGIPATLAIVLGVLAGCGWFDSDSEDVCPKMVGLDDAVRQVKFQRGGGRDLTDITHIITLRAITGDCTADYEARQLDANIIVEISAESGPADIRREGLIRYFVALVGPQREILYRAPFSTVFAFPEQANGMLIRDEIELEALPLTVGRDVRTYRIVAGLILLREELRYNRENLDLVP